MHDVAHETEQILLRLGALPAAFGGGDLIAHSPITGEVIGRVRAASRSDVDAVVGEAHRAFAEWREVPAPRRGELVRLLGEELRAARADLARLVTIETGKVVSEGLGEVQEMIDICDFAV